MNHRRRLALARGAELTRPPQSVGMKWLILGILAAGVCLSGCAEVSEFTKTDRYRFLSPEKVIEPPERSPINPILPSIGLVDQSQEIVPNATFPREGDWSYTDEDYVLGPTDVVNISILDLFQEGLETVLQREISASGYIDLPLLPESYGGQIRAEGLTKEQLRQAIIRAYSPDVLIDPTVSVTIAARRQSTFSILGAVTRPGQYPVVRKDMRLLEALAMAGGVTQANIRYIYVIRPAPAVRQRKAAPSAAQPEEASEQLPSLPEELPAEEAPPEEAVEPPAPARPAEEPAVEPPSEEETSLEDALRELEQAMPGDGAPNRPEETRPVPSAMPLLAEMAGATGEVVSAQSQPAEEESQHQWVYREGKWTRLPKAEAEEPQELPAETEPAGPSTGAPTAEGEAQPAPPSEPAPEEARPPAPRPGYEGTEEEDPFGWRRADRSHLARIIAISLPQLREGNPRMNVVIRDHDIIQVPFIKPGEFYVWGEVLSPGVYSLAGRRVTVKQAIAAARGFGPLAWPKNSVLIRRISDNQEQMIPLDLEAIWKGKEPDILLKPDDIIAVGTDVRASFYAVMRNAFRMTYGFGFIYDRNFSDPLFVTPKSNRFTRL